MVDETGNKDQTRDNPGRDPLRDYPYGATRTASGSVRNNPNPKSDFFGENGANGILVHIGNPYELNMFSRGGSPYSTGCQTMFYRNPSGYDTFMSNLGSAWTGKYYLKRQ